MNRIVPLAFLAALFATPAHAGRNHEAIPLNGPHITHQSFAAGGARLGVGITDIGPELQDHFGADGMGVLVSSVSPDSAAAAAGVEVGDVIVGLGGSPIVDGRELRRRVQEVAGGSAELAVVRAGKRKLLTVEVAKPEGDVSRGDGAMGRRFDLPGGEGRVFVYRGDGGEVDLEIDGIQKFLEESMPRAFERHAVGDQELDELHARIDDLEQQLLEMTERMEQAADRIQDRLDTME